MATRSAALFRWFWRFLAMTILLILVALLTRHVVVLPVIEALAYFGILVSLGLAGLAGAAGAVLFIFHKAMQP